MQDSRNSLLVRLTTSRPNKALGIMEAFSLFGEIEAKNTPQGSSSKQRQLGVYYTSFSLARAIVDEAIRLKGTSQGTFFEPCVGGGAFLIAFIEAVFSDKDPTLADLEDVLNNCYVADKDSKAIESLLEVLPIFMKARFGHEVSLPRKNVFVGDSLFDYQDGQVGLKDFQGGFGLPERFDFIATNPPYLLLKNDSRASHDEGGEVASMVKSLETSNILQFGQGARNLYKVFTEAILRHWLAKDGVAGLLIPRSLLTDNQSEKLRNFILTNFELGTIVQLHEGNEHFKGVGQAFSAFALKQGGITREVAFGEIEESGFKIKKSSIASVDTLRKISKNGSLHNLDVSDIQKLERLSRLKTFGEAKKIVNLRGEFDLTLDRGFLTSENTGLELLQGTHIEYYSFTPSGKYVQKEFLDRPKGKWVHTHRLACQQISNMNTRRRLKWTRIPPGYVLANSCNFIAVDADDSDVDIETYLDFLLGILNSELMNWRFRLLSANNHVSNYEIANFPLGEAAVEKRVSISQLVSNLRVQPDGLELETLEQYIAQYFSDESNSSF